MAARGARAVPAVAVALPGGAVRAPRRGWLVRRCRRCRPCRGPGGSVPGERTHGFGGRLPRRGQRRRRAAALRVLSEATEGRPGRGADDPVRSGPAAARRSAPARGGGRRALAFAPGRAWLTIAAARPMCG